jgi:hypothetical protein
MLLPSFGLVMQPLTHLVDLGQLNIVAVPELVERSLELDRLAYPDVLGNSIQRM